MDTEIVKIILAFVVLIHPFSALTLFLDTTRGYKPADRRNFARVTSLTVFVTIAFFTIAGETLLRALGISIGSFQIAGGILVFLIALNMMNGEGNPVKPDQDNVEWDEWSDWAPREGNTAAAVVPMAIPMIIGPGGISTVIIYAAQVHTWQQKLAIIIAGLVIAIFCYLALSAATQLSRVLGDTGLNIISRIMGMLLAAVAIEILVSGLVSIFPNII